MLQVWQVKNFVGIDISKLWFDAAKIKADNPSQIIHQQFAQKPESLKKNEGVVVDA